MTKEPVAGIVVAMPEERKALLEKAETNARRTLEGVPLYEGSISGKMFCLLESGMGEVNAARAANLLLNTLNPSILISAGFCGAVRKEAKVADLVICSNVSLFDRDGLHEVVVTGGRQVAARLAAALTGLGVSAWPGSFITTATIAGKREISAMLPDEMRTPVLEMESAAVASAAYSAGIPFIGIRSVSDPWDEELDFTIDELTDEKMRISIAKVMGACIRKPRIIPQLARLASNSGRAGKTLGRGVSLIMPML